jgi:uncharacterized spore protein YtfJ
MDVQELLSRVTQDLSVKRVFGEPIERDGVVVVPVAHVRGGAGGGGGGNQTTTEEGFGGGGGIDARPAGVYVIKDGEVTWQPAIDVTRLAIGGQFVVIVLALVVRSLVRRRR